MTSAEIRQAIADLKAQYATNCQIFEQYNELMNARQPIPADLLAAYLAAQQFGSTYNSVLADLEAQLQQALTAEKEQRVEQEATALRTKTMNAIALLAQAITDAATATGGTAAGGVLADLYYFWNRDNWPSGIYAQRLTNTADFEAYIEALPNRRAKLHCLASYGLSASEQQTAQGIVDRNGWN
jgi:ABC-type transporter Mla subunit MlaD